MTATQSSSSLDPFLVFGLSILMFVMLIINVYILVYWQHPGDNNQSYLAKLLIVFGLQLSAVSMLMLPVGVFHY
jgi:LMBR1 domain-containing protein 1